MDAAATPTLSAAQARVARRTLDLAKALKEAAFWALVTLGLSIPILSFRTDQGQSNELILRPRWGLVALLCALVFALRLIGETLGSHRRSRPARPQALATDPSQLSAIQRIGTLGLPVFLGIAVTFPLLVYLGKGGLSESRYWVDLGILILTYVMLGWGLNIVVGLAGLLDLGYVAFYAVGAYTAAVFTTTLHTSAWAALPFAVLFAVLAGVLLGAPTLRLRGDYLAIVTLGFGEIVRIVAQNTEFLGATRGISGISHPESFGHVQFKFDSLPYYYLVLAAVVIAIVATVRLARSRVGRSWAAVREDEDAAEAMGVPTFKMKLWAFAVGASTGGLAGWLYATKVGFINPDGFPFILSVLILSAVVLGGMGSIPGVIAG
ncbi:MAG: ABC transporter permease subunit, partial [Microvirga sp.]